ncbi:MAG: recombinase family protein [Desulfovibrio sp.]|nr:recombinase family protein [Desulfovibrio sp.]
MAAKYISYIRVSTQKQGRSGLGLEAQQAAIGDYLRGNGGELVQEFREVESGRKNDRAELAKALKLCRLLGAVLLIAKLDRLSRNAVFLLQLQDSGVDFVCCDMPGANRMTIGVMALVAEQEARFISTRTREALAAAKARGEKLGNPNGAKAFGENRGSAKGGRATRALADKRAADLASTVLPLRESGMSLAGVADYLNSKGFKTARGGKWYAATVKNLVARLEASAQ